MRKKKNVFLNVQKTLVNLIEKVADYLKALNLIWDY